MDKRRNLQAEADAELLKFRQETIFPNDMLPPDFRDLALKCLGFIPILKNPIKPDEFIALQETSHYSITQIGILLTSMSNRSMRELEMDVPTYVEFMKMWHGVNEVYTMMMQPEVDRIKRKYETLQDLEMQKMQRTGGLPTLEKGKAKHKSKVQEFPKPAEA